VHPDDDLARRVAARLVDDPQVTDGEVRVSVQNRVVILRGHVPTPEARMAAGRRAWSTPGVFDVCNRLNQRG
jgi:osmotically-inducible protein OsmY